MLTDAILKEATAEAERFLLSIVPEGEELHVFSKRFERKMEKLIHRTNHPIRYQAMRIAAAIVLAIVTLFGAVMAVSPEARAAVVGWIRETFGIYTHYASNAATPNNTTPGDADTDPIQYEYHFSVVPEGYIELMVEDTPGGKTYLYVGELGDVLQFTYSYEVENGNLFIETENYEHHKGYVHNLAADVYIAMKQDETSAIVWQDLQNGIIFEIYAIANQSELIALAETISKIQ